MECREGCGACCIAPGISKPFYGMPEGKPAGVRCVHLDEAYRCKIFDDPRRPDTCAKFAPEPAFCGGSRDEALAIMLALEGVELISSDG